MTDMIFVLVLIPFSLVASLTLTRWAGMHKEEDYLFVFGTIALLIFLGTPIVMLGSSFHAIMMESVVSLTVSPTNLTLGENVTVSGMVQPSRANVTIRIWCKLPKGAWNPLVRAQTDETGHFSLVWTPTETGRYEVKAIWIGDMETTYDESPVKVVMVE